MRSDLKDTWDKTSRNLRQVIQEIHILWEWTCGNKTIASTELNFKDEKRTHV